MPTPTGGFRTVKPLEYVEEVDYGVFPTNPTMQWVGVVQNPVETRDIGLEEVETQREDIYRLIGGSEKYTLKFDYLLQSSTFAKYGVNAQGGGAGSIDKSLSLGQSILLDGVENFIKYVGGRINTIKFTGKPGSPTTVSVELLLKEITPPSTTDYKGTGTHASDPNTDPWRFEDGSVTWGNVELDVTEINVSVNRNLKPIYTTSTKVKYLPPTARRISGSLTVVWTDAAKMQDLHSITPKTLTWTLKSGVSTLTLFGVYLTKLDLPFTLDDVIYEKYAFTATSASVT
ncbi:MAG: phage tail tube protein [Nitrososphaerales archaeon]